MLERFHLQVDLSFHFCHILLRPLIHVFDFGSELCVSRVLLFLEKVDDLQYVLELILNLVLVDASSLCQLNLLLQFLCRKFRVRSLLLLLDRSCLKLANLDAMLLNGLREVIHLGLDVSQLLLGLGYLSALL